MEYRNYFHSVYTRVANETVYSVCTECPFLPRSRRACALGYDAREILWEGYPFIGAPNCKLVYVDWRIKHESETE